MNPEKRERNLAAFDRVMTGESVRKVGADYGISQSRLYEVIRDQLRKRGFQGQYGRWLLDARAEYAKGFLHTEPAPVDTSHCKHGHLYDAGNTTYRLNRVTNHMDRVCLTCKRINARKYNARKTAKRKAARYIPATWARSTTTIVEPKKFDNETLF